MAKCPDIYLWQLAADNVLDILQLIDEYQKNFGESWRTVQADNAQPWPYLNEALAKFQILEQITFKLAVLVILIVMLRCKVGRYGSPEEHPFFPDNLSSSVLPQYNHPRHCSFLTLFVKITCWLSILPTGFKAANHMVFSGVYPTDGSDFEALNSAIERLICNDASVSVTKESSTTLGLGFRCGFLGLLHMDVFHQRLEQEHGAHVISTVPTVPYTFEFSDGSKLQVQNPAALPSNPKNKITCWEPTVLATIIIPSEYVGPVITLCSDHRGEQLEYTFIDREH
ncbi:hypothetical protein POM88_006551 [Heracleum sosnowskyi]|uniref:chorismate mutase n=2 Tax=Heracleum sosnowskyi TaxID=360622 RepID=A0AAD8J524_9APIA|nr:hypothetical protein POM88_006551 [Heracleum sosnowskyi]